MSRFLFSFVYLIASLCAELKVADIFSDHMVLQSDQVITVWGWDKPDQKVFVEFKGQSQSTKTKSDGSWLIKLEAEEASSQSSQLRVQGSSQTIFNDVLVGEVWLASGQSNMEWKVKGCIKKIPLFQSIIDKADKPQIRFREIKTKESHEPQSQLGDGKSWLRCNPEQALNLSAVCFFTAIELFRELEVPIGIIETAWGGHPIEPFIPEQAFIGHPVLETILKYSKDKDFESLKQMEGGVHARNDSWLAGTVFNSRLAPITSYAIRGAFWYQAESNSGKAEDPRFYEQKMKALMRGWRQAWQQPSLPIYYVQLPQYDSVNWVRMRDEQRRAMSEAHSGMAVISDLEPYGIHPPNKLDVAKRLSLWPLAKQYNKKVTYSGPLYLGHEVRGNQLIIHFKHSEVGLTTGIKADLHETLLSRKPDAVTGFEICDQNGNWKRAQAKIIDNKVICSHSSISQPIGVRYAWAPTMPSDFKWNLYNKAGLPASPFISDPELAPFTLDGDP